MALHRVIRSLDLKTCLKGIRFYFKSIYLGLSGDDTHVKEAR